MGPLMSRDPEVGARGRNLWQEFGYSARQGGRQRRRESGCRQAPEGWSRRGGANHVGAGGCRALDGRGGCRGGRTQNQLHCGRRRRRHHQRGFCCSLQGRAARRVLSWRPSARHRQRFRALNGHTPARSDRCLATYAQRRATVDRSRPAQRPAVRKPRLWWLRLPCHGRNDPELKRRLGGLAYVLTGVSRFKELSANRGRFRAEGFSWEGPFVAVAIGNGRQAGGGVPLCPDALIDDGLLDLMILPELDHAARLAAFSHCCGRVRRAFAPNWSRHDALGSSSSRMTI